MPIDVPVQMPCRGFKFAAYETVHIITTLYDNATLFLFIKKTRTHLDLLSIPQSGWGKCQNV